MIFVPAGCDPAKTAVMTAVGAQVFEVVGGYRAAFDLSRRAAAQFGWLDRNTGVNPKTVEGKKTVSFEVWEQLGRRAPDVMVLPVGDGPTLMGAAKGFRELVACGAISRPPRIIAVQAEGCAPLAARWRGESRDPGSWPGTAADGIAVPDPVIGDVVLDEVRQAGGTFVTVPDQQILDAVAELATDGVSSEPAGAAAYAGLRLALAANEVAPTETAVVLVTGAELTAVPRPAARPGRSFRIGSSLAEVARALSSTT